MRCHRTPKIFSVDTRESILKYIRYSSCTQEFSSRLGNAFLDLGKVEIPSRTSHYQDLHISIAIISKAIPSQFQHIDFDSPIDTDGIAFLQFAHNHGNGIRNPYPSESSQIDHICHPADMRIVYIPRTTLIAFLHIAMRSPSSRHGDGEMFRTRVAYRDVNR